jgi:hypothetical protein
MKTAIAGGLSAIATGTWTMDQLIRGGTTIWILRIEAPTELLTGCAVISRAAVAHAAQSAVSRTVMAEELCPSRKGKEPLVAAVMFAATSCMASANVATTAASIMMVVAAVEEATVVVVAAVEAIAVATAATETPGAVTAAMVVAVECGVDHLAEWA